MRAPQSWTALYGRAVSLISSATDEQRRLASLAFAASVVTGAFLLQRILAGGAYGPQFWLFHVAIALTAVVGGVEATCAAALLVVLLARLSSPVPLPTALLFGLEGMAIALIIRHLRRSLDDATSSIRQLELAERHAIRIDRAFRRLDEASKDTALVILDHAGHVTEWCAGATRLYGFSSGQMAGREAAALFGESDRVAFPRLLAEAREATARHNYRQVRGDGTTFDAELEVAPLSPGGLDGFTMFVRDLTHQQARAAADSLTAVTQAQLRGEIEVAQWQLSTLQEVTDPTLNSLGGVEFVSALLDRLRAVIHADGIALIDVGQRPHQVLCATEGLQCREVRHRAALVAHDTARAVMVHNDPAGVAEMSAAVWPGDVSSLIAVPVVRAGLTTAVMEVVNRTGRRATEWEIALARVVAARIAGVRDDAPAANAGWLSGSDLRLTLGDRGGS